MTRILVVDDSPAQAQELAHVLESEQFVVETAASAEEGVRVLERSGFDLVIADTLMPGLSGFELCQRIRGLGAETGRIPVLLLTTLRDPMDIIRGLASGADNFVAKPFEPTSLIGRIRTLLATKQLRQTAGPGGHGVDILLLGKTFTITAEKEQIVDLLISTFEDIVRTNRELEASRHALNTANKELEGFTYSVSHDLRAPLRAIEGFTRILLEDHDKQLDEKGHDYLVRVLQGAVRMEQLIEDLLGLARLARSELLRRGDVDLSAMARACAGELERRDPARRIEWSIAEGLKVDADARLLKIVVENLLANAWKFTRQRRPAHIGLAEMRLGGEVVYVVRDDGAGFNMAYADRLFAPFQRLHPPSEFEGTGIGLATVQRIIHRHGGRIWAEGAVGQGAEFFFTLGD